MSVVNAIVPLASGNIISLAFVLLEFDFNSVYPLALLALEYNLILPGTLVEPIVKRQKSVVLANDNKS